LWPACIFDKLSRGPFLHETPHHPSFPALHGPHHPHPQSPDRLQAPSSSTTGWPANLCGWNPQRPAVFSARPMCGPQTRSVDASLARKPSATSPHSPHLEVPDDSVALNVPLPKPGVDRTLHRLMNQGPQGHVPKRERDRTGAVKPRGPGPRSTDHARNHGWTAQVHDRLTGGFGSSP
jgi:hypothetical protein